ncbi:MAG: Hsp33 family molecular chaperone HslO [Candidatus Coproplasma sp.]
MDRIKRFLAFSGNVQVTVLETTELVNKAIKIHSTTPSASKILGGLLTCCAYFASGIKADSGAVSITVKAKDGDGAVSVSSDADLHVRGYADGSCTQTLQGGSLTVVREDGYSQPFVGTCEIDSDDVSDAFAKYFQQSEQIPTAVKVEVTIDESGRCTVANGLIMQLLPDADDEETDLAGEAFYNFTQDNNSPAYTAEEIVERFFEGSINGEVVEVYPEYKCNCSQSKIKGVLASVGKAELLKICKEQGQVKVHCHYCNTDYIFDEKDIEENF